MKGHRISYSAAEMAWLEANHTLPIAEYHASFLEAFPREDVRPQNLHALRKRMCWKTGRTGCFVKGQPPANKGTQCAPGTGGLHPNARRTQFKKGQLPHNTKYLGHERINKDGYVEISVAQTNPHTGYERRYVHKHVHLWVEKNGPVPPGHALKCLGEKTNTDPSNWEAVPRALLPRLNGKSGRGYDAAHPELKPAIMAVAKLEHATRKRRKDTPPA